MSLSTITPNKAVVFAVGCFILYWVLALVVPPMILRDVFNSLAFGAAVIIAATWAPSAFKAVREGANSGEWQLILGIFIVWFVVMCQRVYVIIFNWQGRPDSWADGPVSGFWPYSFTIAGMLFLVASGTQTQGFRVGSVWAIMAAVGIGCLMAGILIGTSISSG